MYTLLDHDVLKTDSNCISMSQSERLIRFGKKYVFPRTTQFFFSLDDVTVLCTACYTRLAGLASCIRTMASLLFLRSI